MQEVPIEWRYTGRADLLCGTDATRAERWLAYGMAAVLTAVVLMLDLTAEEPIAPGWRLLVLALFAYDIAGGAVANMLNSCKRFYHSPVQPGEGRSARLAKNPRLFTAIHIHPVIAAYLFEGSVLMGVIWYLLLQASIATILAMPLYLRRAGASAIVLLAMFGSWSVLPLGQGLEWFVPCLFMKMVLGHAVREEPYRQTRALD